MTTEQWLSKLENESKALKQGFERSATSIPLFTKSISYSTNRNAMTMTYTGASMVVSEPERVIVTFNTLNSLNTLAKLEIQTDSNRLPLVRRLPYSGGARWSVTAGTKNDSTWETTNYTFVVHSFINGEISVSEVSS